MTEQLGLFYKERGMRLAETAEAIHGEWVKKADAAIWWLAHKGLPFSAEDVRAYAGSPAHPNAMGARLNAAARKGLIVKAGTVKASRSERHANEMRLWIGAGKSQGERIKEIADRMGDEIR